MRSIGVVLVFASTLFLGTWGGSIGTTVEPYLAAHEVNISGFDLDAIGIAPEPRGIQVSYAGIRSEARDGGKLFLIFFIRNGTDEPLAYTGHSAGHAFPHLKVDGKELPGAYIWSRESNTYTIQPGRSAKVYIDREEFLVTPPENTLSEAGFLLHSTSGAGAAIHYSKPFRMPNAFEADSVTSGSDLIRH